MGIRIKGDRIDEGHVKLPVRHNALVGSHIYNLADYAAAVLVRLVFNELAFQAKREFVDYRGVYGFRLAGGKAGFFQFVRDFVALL